MNNENLKGMKLEFDNCLFFQFSNILYNKEIIIVDMEMNGSRVIRNSEIIEFYGIKVKRGEIIDTFDFKCKHTKYGICEDLIENNILDLDDYESRNTIDFYIKDLVKFLDNSIIFLWGSSYDRFVLINMFRNFNLNKFTKKIKYIDFQHCLRLTNSDFFEEKWFSLNELFNSLFNFYSSKDNVNEDLWPFIKDVKINGHSAKDDVWKLIFLVLGYSVEIGKINWEEEIRNIRANLTFYRRNKNKQNK